MSTDSLIVDIVVALFTVFILSCGWAAWQTNLSPKARAEAEANAPGHADSAH